MQAPLDSCNWCLTVNSNCESCETSVVSELFASQQRLTAAGTSIEIQDKAKPVGKPWNPSVETLDPIPATLAESLHVLHSKMLIFKSAPYSLRFALQRSLCGSMRSARFADMLRITQSDGSMEARCALKKDTTDTGQKPVTYLCDWLTSNS
jgi:hypothetical protein